MAGKKGKCPGCGTVFLVPSGGQHDDRKAARTLVEECTNCISMPDDLTSSTSEVLCRVMYTEAPPLRFTKERQGCVPILDLSEGGLSFYMKDEDGANSLERGSTHSVQIDFPIFVVPVVTQVEIRWLKPVAKENITQIGIKFCRSDPNFKRLIENLIDYILSRSDYWESVD